MAEQPPALASSADVKAVLGRDLTAEELLRAPDLLKKASALFRREAEQLFTEGTSDVRLKVNAGRVYLPERPVRDVTSVTDDDGHAVTYTRRQQWLSVPQLGSDAFVVVIYDHGSTEVPDLVRITVAEVVRKVFLTPDDVAEGVTRRDESRGPFSESRTYAAWAVGGQTQLSPADAEIARSFRFRPPRIWAAQAQADPGWTGPDVLRPR